MASQGPNNPATAANVDEAGSSAWANPTNVFTSNNSNASCVISLLDPEGDSSDNLDVTNFSFTLPGSATITGVVVGMERSKTPAGGTIQDLLIQLIKGGTAQGDDKSSATLWPNAASEAYQTYGSSSDLWGLSLSVSDVNASDFGVRIRCINPGFDAAAATAQVDHVRITVHYTVAGGAPLMMMIGVGM